MKHIISSILFCLPFFISAQNKTFVELSFGQQQYGQLLALEDPSADGYFNYRSIESGKITPSGLLAFSREINSGISIKSGFQVQTIRFEADLIDENDIKRVLARATFSIPILVKLELFPKKSWHPYVETGIITTYTLYEQSITKDKAGNTNVGAYRNYSQDAKDRLYFSVAYNMGISKQVTSKSLLFIQGTSSIQLDKTTELGVSERLYNIGLDVGIKYAI